MQKNELTKHIDFLLSQALKKCENLHDAEDLVGETLLTALLYLEKGNTINDLRGWLLTVLNHKRNDSLRQKYRRPIIGIGEGFDIAEESTLSENIEKSEEAMEVRRAVAYLARLHREVIVRHYMKNESISSISKALGISEGTVKSRLYGGREEIRKGMTMKKYGEQSYDPVKLIILNSGNNGRNGEPYSLVKNDLLAQNILVAAYRKPISVTEIAQTIGTPTSYVEAVIKKLSDGELLKKIGNKYYTDFIIFTENDKERFIPEQKRFAKEYFSLIWNPIKNGISKLQEEDFYKRCSFDAKNSLTMYFAFNCLDYGIYGTFSEIFETEQEFPYRSDGGRWIAFGYVNRNGEESSEYKKYSYTGERFTVYENFAGSTLLRQHVYGADGFPNYSYNRSLDYDFLKESDDVDDIVTRLLYIIHTKTDPESVGFNTEYLKMIPHLTKCKILKNENGENTVNIPILNEAEFDRLCSIMAEAKEGIRNNSEFKTVFAEFLKDKKQQIPPHLKSVPLYKQYLFAENAILFSVIREAIVRGELYDGNYDDDSNGINQHPCPMFLVIEP